MRKKIKKDTGGEDSGLYMPRFADETTRIESDRAVIPILAENLDIATERNGIYGINRLAVLGADYFFTPQARTKTNGEGVHSDTGPSANRKCQAHGQK